MDGSRQKSTRRWLPYALGAVLVAQFVGLGLWQISRAQEKRATQAAFERQTGTTRFVHGMDVQPLQQLSAEGTFDVGHQFLLDNIIVDSRYGHYILTPLVHSDSEPALIVNRGWIESSGGDIDPSALAVSAARNWAAPIISSSQSARTVIVAVRGVRRRSAISPNPSPAVRVCSFGCPSTATPSSPPATT